GGSAPRSPEPPPRERRRPPRPARACPPPDSALHDHRADLDRAAAKATPWPSPAPRPGPRPRPQCTRRRSPYPPSRAHPSRSAGRPARRLLSPSRVPGAGCRAQPRLMLSEPPPHLGILLTELFHRLEPGAPPAPAAPAPAPGLSMDQLAEV